jgi:hypothetical protein
MDREAVLKAFDEQIRRRPRLDASGDRIEQDDRVIRYVSDGDGWNGVTYLDQANADAAIAAQVRRFVEVPSPWEWKYYSYDQPLDLPERLLAAGFTREPDETLLVAEIAELDLDVSPPPGVDLRPVVDERDVQVLVSVHDAVFGGDNAAIGHAILSGLASQPTTVAAVVA